MLWQVRVQQLVAQAICSLPERTAYGLARRVGTCLACIPSARHAALAENISIVHGLPKGSGVVRRDVRRAFQNAMLNYVDLFRLGRYDAADKVENIAVVDWRPFDEANARGKGVILVSAHLGNFDNVVQTLALRGVSTLIPVEPMDPPELLEAIQRQRSRLGTAIIPVGPNTFKQLAAHLRAGGTTVIVSDRDIQGTGHEVKFFGHDVTLPQAAILLALRTGAPVLGAFGYRYTDNAIEGRFTPQFELSKSIERSSIDTRPPTASLRTLLDAGMRELAALLEREISRDPGQWVVQQRAFTRVSADIRPVSISRRLSKVISAVFLVDVAIRVARMAGPL